MIAKDANRRCLPFWERIHGNTYTADEQNNLRGPGFSRIEAENLAQFFDSHAATLFDEDNASLYLKAHVTPCSGRVVANPDRTAFLGITSGWALIHPGLD